MEQYIKKSDIIAEIKSLKRTTFTNFDEGVNATVQTLLDFLDTLEVKEVDLEKEIDREIETRWRGEYLFTSKFRESAKHFFELGLKAQKGG